MSKKKPDPQWATFRAEAQLLKQLDDAAKSADRPRSWVIRQLLLRALANQEKQV